MIRLIGSGARVLSDAALLRRSGTLRRRNIARNGALVRATAARTDLCSARLSQRIEGPMATRQDRQIVETPTEARQAEPGPSVLALLTVSVGLAMLILGVIWFVFFRT